MAAFAWLLIATSNASAAQPAAQSFRIDIPAQSVDSALIALATQTGASVGMTGKMPPVRTRPVNADLTVLAALEVMLEGSPLLVIQTAPLSFRLEARPAADPTLAVPDGNLVPLEEVVITGTKRSQYWFSSPMPVSVLGGEEFNLDAPLLGTRSASQASATISSTNLGPGRNRQFIRGIADSAFNGPSQSTVSVQLDEARVTFDAPDPDLRQVDVARIEVLKGPQGPLYGTGALGGIYHIVTNRPDLKEPSARMAAYGSALESSGVGGGASLVLNAPLRVDQFGLRLVAYGGQEQGWIDNVQGRNNANTARVAGGRLSLRARPSASWMLDFSGVAQSVRVDDSQYVIEGYPGYQRDGISPEPNGGDFYVGQLTASGTIGEVNVLVTTSGTYQEVSSLLDASAAAPQFGLQGSVGYDDSRTYRMLNQELRLTGRAGARLDWLAGAALMSARSKMIGSLQPESGASLPEVTLSQHAEELAAFGELRAGLVRNVNATAGLRIAGTRLEDELQDGDGSSFSSSDVSVTPSIAFDWQPAGPDRYYYFRFAQAERPGGLAPGTGGVDNTYKADELSSYNLGARLVLDDAALTIDTALFAAHWSHIQSDYLLPNGIVATQNVGDGDNFGLEATLHWRPGGSWTLDGDALLQRARLTHAKVDVDDDPRLPVVPDVRLRAVLGRTFSLGAWTGVLSGELGYTGPSRLSFEEELDRKIEDYATLAIAFGLTRPGWSLMARLDNATNSRADTFAYGNPFSVREADQHTPLPPRSLTLSLTHLFDR